MSTIRANKWVIPVHNSTSEEVVSSAPIKITQVNVPYCATAYTGSFGWLENATTSNTGSLYSFSYTPAAASSYINILAFLECDRNNNSNTEELFIFINNSPYASSYTYPRNSGHEPWQMRGMACQYTNSSASAITIDIRCRNASGWTQFLGQCNGGGTQVMTNSIQIIEYLR